MNKVIIESIVFSIITLLSLAIITKLHLIISVLNMKSDK